MAEAAPSLGPEQPEGTLVAFDLEKKKAEPFVEEVSTYVVAAKSGKIAIQKQPGEIYVLDGSAPAPSNLSESKVSLDGIVIDLDPREEWTQIYYEGWRHMRDFYFDPGLAGIDWKAVRDRYATLLPRLATREDLRDLMGELIGELSTSHTYTFGGDPGVDFPRVSTGLLGADIVQDGGAFRIRRILRGDPADNVRSPLAEPGVEVHEGDYVLAVNHKPLDPASSYLAGFEGLAGKPVLLTVGDKPSPDKPREVVVTPLGDEGRLLYADWVRRTREYVLEKSGGRIGYVHIPDMDSQGLIAFTTWFYPQLDKDGMIVDCRWNRGGYVSQMILERFRRKVISFDRARGGGIETYPSRTLNGPFAVLTNEFAGSDGDIFPAAVQLEALAPVIGMRSWGGVVGIRADKAMVDGGLLTQPEFAWWDRRQGWGLENRGVIPDIELQNMPQELAKGVDAQLDRAVLEVLDLMKKNPPLRPEFGPVPKKGREAYTNEP